MTRHQPASDPKSTGITFNINIKLTVDISDQINKGIILAYKTRHASGEGEVSYNKKIFEKE